MQELLEREFDRFLDDLKKRLEAARSLEDIVRIFVTKNFDEVDRGSAIQILRGQPDIRETIRKKEKKEERRFAQYLVATGKILSKILFVLLLVDSSRYGLLSRTAKWLS
jgi:hypothetical protein